MQWKRDGNLIGLACIEDAKAESVNLDGHVQSERSWFSGISKLLHGKDGRFQFACAWWARFGKWRTRQCWTPTISAEEARRLLTESVFEPHRLDGVRVPRVVMIRTSPSSTPLRVRSSTGLDASGIRPGDAVSRRSSVEPF